MPQRKGRKGKKRQNKRVRETAPLTIQVMRNAAATSRNIIPDEFDTCLEFVDDIVVNNVGLAFAVRRFISNGAWDVDPTLGSTATAGLAELATLYLYYRVVAYETTFNMANADTFPLSWYVVHTNTDPGTSGLTNYQGASANAFGAIGVLGASTGASTHKYRSKRMKVSEVVGAIDVETGDNWRGTTSAANPPDTIFVGVAFASPTGAVFVNGVVVNVCHRMWVRLYDRRLLTT